MQLDELVAKYGDDLYVALDKLNIEPAESFSDEEVARIDAELAAPVKEEPKEAPAPTKKNGSKKSALTAQQKQQKAGKNITAVSQEATKNTIAVRSKQGQQMAEAGNRAMVTGYLEGTAQGLAEFNQSILAMGQHLGATVEDASLLEAEEIEALDGNEDFLALPSGGGFSLM